MLNSIGQRLTGDKSVSDTELKTAQQEMLNAAATLKILENANHIKVQGKHNDIDFENLEKYKGDKQMEEFIKHQSERIEEAKNGKIDPKELQKDLDKAKNDAEKTVESEGGKMMRTGAEELSNFFKEDVQLGVVDGKGGQAQTDKAKDGNGNQGNVSTNRDGSGDEGKVPKFERKTKNRDLGDNFGTSNANVENLTLNRNNGGSSDISNKSESTTTFSTNGNNVTVAGNSGFFFNNSTSSSTGTSANVQGNLFGYGTVGISKVESISAGTGNTVTASSDIGTVRSKTKETPASNTDEPETPKINTNNITIGKNNNNNNKE